MAKRLFAMLLVVAMLLSFMPVVGVAAEDTLDKHTSHEGWTAWNDSTTLPTEAGKYYLTCDVELTAAVTINANVDLCLDGHTVTQKTSGKRHIYLGEGKGITFNLYDCVGTGTLTGGSMGTGAVINVTRTTTFNMYGGKITGNVTTGDAIIYVQAANATYPTGGVFNMYGGEISGNQCKNGTIYGAGGGASYTNSQVNIYGGTIKDNVATASGGAIFVKTYGTLKIENATITGNKAATAGSAIYAEGYTPISIKNTTITGNIGTANGATALTDGYSAAVYMCGYDNTLTVSGKVVISGNTTAAENIKDVVFKNDRFDTLQVTELTAGSDIVYKTNAISAEAAGDIIAIAKDGSQDGLWYSEWVTYVGADGEAKHLTYGKDGFYFVEGHYHGDQKYVAWTKTNALPDGDGETGVGYYLTEDVSISTTDNRSVMDSNRVLHLCLNGKTVTQSIANAGNSESSELIRVSNGALYLQDCTTVYDEDGYFVSGGKLTGGNKKGNGSALYINKATSVVEVTGIEISGNNSTVTSDFYGGAGVMARYNTTPAKFVGCKFADNTAASTGGAAMAARDGGKIEAEKCYFYKNQAKYGSAIYVYESCATLVDCVFEENTASESGGAITTATNTEKTTTNTVVIDGCTFTENSAKNAGAINVGGVTTMTINDTTITGNTNASSGGYGAVNNSNSKAVVKITGKTVIYDNLNKDGKPQNLHLQQYEGVVYDLSELSAEGKIGVSLLADRITAGFMFFTPANMTAVPGNVTSDDTAYTVQLQDGRLVLAEGGSEEPEPDPEPPVVVGHTHKLCNDSACTSHGAAITFEPWEATDSLPTAGNYYLVNNVKLTAAVETTGALNLCLNGKTVTAASGKRILGVKIGTTTSVTDCGTTGKITGGGSTYGSAISVRYASTFNLFGGKITGNSSTSEGTVYLQGGTVDDSKNYPVAGTFNMYGGEISGNSTKMGAAVSSGAPVGAVTQVPAINIYGGKITGNTTTNRGGAINASGKATIYIENAEISGNSTSGEGGAIYATTGPTLTIKNAKILNNTAKTAGAISTYGGTVTLDGAVIQGNYASADNYSAVHVANSSVAGNGKLILKGATVITDNTNGDDKIAMNVYLRNNVTVDVSGLTDAAKIGLTRGSDREQDRVSNAPIAEKELLRFESDSAAYVADRDDEGYLILVDELAASDHAHKLCNDASCADHSNVAFKAWNKTDSLPTSGKYYLTANVTLTAMHTVSSNLTLCLNGYSIQQTAKHRVITVNNKATLTITDCSATPGSITGGKNDTGSGIFISEGSTFNFYNGKITGNTAAGTGTAAAAAVFLRSTDGPGATFNMYGGEITGNGNAKSWGGAICNASGNANNTVYVNIYGGKIYGNTAGTGGAIRMEKKSVTTIYGGEIYGNEAATNGGAIYLSSGAPELIIKGGTITGNTAANGAGVYASSGAKVTIEGATVIYDNTVNDKQNNIYLAGNDVITLGALTAAAKIGVGATTANRAITATTDTDYTANVKSDNTALTISYKNKALYLEKVEVSDHYHCVCAGVKNDVCDHAEHMWIQWGDDTAELTSLPINSGYYYLVADITLSEEFVVAVDNDVNLCLNGKTVTQTASSKRHYASNNKATLNITDCNENVGGMTGGNRSYGGSINVVAGSTVNLFAGKIYGNTSNEGGGVYLQGSKTNNDGTHVAGGIFNMYGGEISGNSATTNGAGIKSAGIGGTGTKDPSIVNIYGGKVCGNEAKGAEKVDATTGAVTYGNASGGGIAAGYESPVTIYGGSIYGNTANYQGGGIYLNEKGKLYIKGGKIEANEATSVGGGVFATGKGTTIVMEKGQISGNKGTSGAGLITQTQSTFTMNGGEISGNYASGNAAVYISTNTDFVMNGGEIWGNTAAGSGAGIFFLRSRGTLNGGKIRDNISEYRAGAFASSGATVEINGVTISGNYAPEGGALYIYRSSTTSNGVTTYYPSTVNINDGALITGNEGKSNGAILIANDDVVVTMNGGEISKNKAANGGAIMTWRGSTFIMKGGKITGNQATSNGGAAYISTASTFIMEGGSISNNKAKSAGGIYFLRSEGELKGGSISYNTAQHTSTWKNGKESKSGGTGGGMYISGAKVNFRGTTVSGNYASVNGGGVISGRASYKENGVTKYDLVRVNVYGGLFTGNKTPGAAGAILMQSEGTVLNIYGGTFTNNEAKNAGAIYASTKTTFNMTGGTITRNHATNSGGGLYVYNAKATVTGGQIYANTAVANSGNIMVNGEPAVLTIKNMKIHDGSAKIAGVMVVQSKAHVYAENCDFYDNTCVSGSGGAIYISNNSFGTFTDCKFYNNTSSNYSGALHVQVNAKVDFLRCDFTENRGGTMAGAVYCNPKSVVNMTDCNFSKNVAGENGGAVVVRGTTYMTNVTLENNAAVNGGAIATDTNNTSGAGVRDGLVMHDCEIRNNTASAQGGAIYVWKGREVILHDCEITGNQAGAEGGAIWAYEDTELHNTKITGNASGGEGYAVYMNDANYDGHSYYSSKNKLSGNVIIKDNDGGDLWMGPDVAFAITADGLGENAHIEVTLDSGVVTNRILGIYHYEGGDQVYTITYGDRSMTEPEYDASLAYVAPDAADQKAPVSDVLLYVGIGVIGLAAVAAVVLVVLKKKKSAPAAKN